MLFAGIEEFEISHICEPVEVAKGRNIEFSKFVHNVCLCCARIGLYQRSK